MVQQQHRCELGNVGSHVMECSSRAVPFFSRSFVKSRAFLFVDFNTALIVDKKLLVLKKYCLIQVIDENVMSLL